MEELDRELDDYFPGAPKGTRPQASAGGNGDAAFAPETDRPSFRLSAVPPRRAENNPINMIKKNGDNFVVHESTILLKSPDVGPSAAPPLSSPLGLDADPTGSQPEGPTFVQSYDPQPAPGYADGTSRPLQSPLQPLRGSNKKGFSHRHKVLLLALVVFAGLLVISTFYLSLGPGSGVQTVPPAAVAYTQPQAGEPLDNQIETLPEDDGLIKIAFLSEHNTHHYFENQEAGTLLVLAGQVQNNDDKPISYIRIKGMLTDAQDNVLAERQVFAGNWLTEEELKTLSIRDILSRLSIRSGQNGANMNVAPNASVPYMVVFDRLPSNLGMYLLEPVGYSDAAEASAAGSAPPQN
jgi:hypothetical protein